VPYHRKYSGQEASFQLNVLLHEPTAAAYWRGKLIEFTKRGYLQIGKTQFLLTVALAAKESN
jgi:hypothetical protein